MLLAARKLSRMRESSSWYRPELARSAARKSPSVSDERKGVLLGQGRPAEVFAWRDDRVLKLFRAGWPEALAEQEAHLTRVARDLGLPACEVMEVVRVEGRPGIIMERLEGATMQKTLEANPARLVTLATLLGELHARMHEPALSGLLPLRLRIETQIRDARGLLPDVQDAALGALAQLPDGNALCHGDFHPDNVVITPRGPVIIDWLNATRGDPLADVAHTTLLIQYGTPEGQPLNRLLQWGRSWFRQFYLRRYLQMRSGSHQAIAAWELPQLAAQIDNSTPQEQALILARIKQLL